METETKSKIDVGKVLTTGLLVLLAAGAVGGGTYYVLSSNFQKEREATEKSEKALQEQIAVLKKEVEKQTTSVISNTGATTNTSKTLTNDQIFQEAASQLGLTRSQVAFFRIFGQDKVQYSTGGGVTFAYKVSGKWSIAGDKNRQDVMECSLLNNVPESYRPPCDDGSGDQKYLASDRTPLNYPMSQVVSYIGE